MAHFGVGIGRNITPVLLVLGIDLEENAALGMGM